MSLNIKRLSIVGKPLDDPSVQEDTVGAWSCSKRLSKSYSGPCMRVRRPSDDQEQDIGFLQGKVDVYALRQFLGDDLDGRVVTLYAQDGSTQHLTQPNPSIQPRIQWPVDEWSTDLQMTGGNFEFPYKGASAFQFSPYLIGLSTRDAVGYPLSDATTADTYSFDGQSSLIMTKGAAVENPNLGSAILQDGAPVTGPYELNGYIIESSSVWQNLSLNNGIGLIPPNAFNKTNNTSTDIWHTGNTNDDQLLPPHWLSIKYPKEVILLSYSITRRNGSDQRPNNWLIQGSNDGTQWVTLDTQIDQVESFPTINTTVRYSIQSSTYSYVWFRLYITDVQQDFDLVAIGQWRLFTYPSSSATLIARQSLKASSNSRIVQTKTMPARGISYDDLISLITVSRKDLLTTLNGSPTSIADQVSGVWNFGGTVTPTLEDGVPCLDMTNGYLELPSLGATLGQEYTVFYYWKPKLSSAIWRSLHRNDDDIIVIVESGGTDLGMYSTRNGYFRDSGYNIVPNVWQTLVVTSVGDTSTSNTGTGTFYVNNTQVGTVDRVGSGTRMFRVGWLQFNGDIQAPGHVAVAGVFNRALSRREITKLHHILSNWGREASVPRSIGSFIPGERYIIKHFDRLVNYFPYPLDIYAWTTSSTLSRIKACSIFRDTISSPVGNTPIRMRVSGDDPYIGTYDLPGWNITEVSPGETWYLTIFVKASVPASYAQIYIFSANSNGRWNTNSSKSFDVTENWNLITHSFTFSATDSYLQIRLDGPQTYIGNIDVWWDGCRVYKKV